MSTSGLNDVSIELDVTLAIYPDGEIEIFSWLTERQEKMYSEMVLWKTVDTQKLTVKLVLPVALRNRINQLKQEHKNGLQSKETRNTTAVQIGPDGTLPSV